MPDSQPLDISIEDVNYALSWIKYPDWQRTLGLIVKVEGDWGVPDFSVVPVWEADGTRHETPGAFAFMEDSGPHLLPRCPVALAFDPELLSEFRCRAQMLSSDQHGIELRTRGRAFYRIPGAGIAGFFDKSDE